MLSSAPVIDRLEVQVFRLPTDRPESDGTILWDQTTAIVVRIQAGGKEGLGMTYSDPAAGQLIDHTLQREILGRSALDPIAVWNGMTAACRNLGRPGLGLMGISAVDFALWDLKAKWLDLPMHRLLGSARDAVPIYGSGGFTTYSERELVAQLAGWVDQGMSRVKMKVGRDPRQDADRVRAARGAVGAKGELFVDANGAYDVKQALELAEEFGCVDVTWFEEPVSSDDLEGLALLRARAPAGMAIAAGEYGFDTPYFRRMCAAGAVDVLQIDATRCGGITGFLKAAAVADSFMIPVSTHCAPSMHVALGVHLSSIRHLEYFHDHARLEHLFFDGAIAPVDGALRPDDSRSGFGLELRAADVARYAA